MTQIAQREAGREQEEGKRRQSTDDAEDAEEEQGKKVLSIAAQGIASSWRWFWLRNSASR